MVKRVNHLFDQVVRFDNLFRAWKKARQGTGWNKETLSFFYALEPELLRLQNELLTDTYQPGNYRFFDILDPKPRKIAVAPFRDRVVHHALIHVLNDHFEKVFIYDSYATRVNKGTHKAIERAQQFSRRYRWYYKMDVEHFFETVDQNTMMALIHHKIKDSATNRLAEKIIRNAPGDKGLPIGNLTSQFFANIYLNPLDHFIKERLRIKGYLRYMDDFVIFSDNPIALKCQQLDVEAFLNDFLQLKLKHKASWLNQTQHGLSFLGIRIFPGLLRHCPENRRRSLKKSNQSLSAFQNGAISEQQMSDSLRSIYAHLNYYS